MPVSRALLPALLVLLAALPSPRAGAYAPVVVLGLKGEGVLYSEEQRPAEGGAGLGLEALFAWRLPWGEDGFFAARASSSLDWLPDPSFGPPALYDEQVLGLEARLPGTLNRLGLAAGLKGSFAGSLDGEAAYLRPDWRLALRLGPAEGGGETELSARGYWLAQPEGDEDSLYQGLRLSWQPASSIRARRGLLLEAGWELWPEQPLYDAAGDPTAASRRDLVGWLEGSLGGLAGYFLDWSLTAELGGRLSNANRWLSAEIPSRQLQESSEDRVCAGLRAEVRWSPHRQVALDLGAFARQELYPQRDALTAAGTLSGQRLRVLSAGLDLRADWSPDDRLFLVLDASAGRRFANETAEERWNLQGGLGLQLRL